MNAPLNLLTSSGAAAGPVAALTWGLLAISIAVVLIITFLVVAGILRRQVPLPPGGFAEAPVERLRRGLALDHHRARRLHAWRWSARWSGPWRRWPRSAAHRPADR